MADLIRRSDVIGLLEDMLLFGEYDIIASSFSEADEEKAYRAINDIPAVNRWISVEDSLPDEFIYVICGGKDGMAILRYNGNVWVDDAGCTYSISAITHWMPLPETPKEDET